MSRFFPHAAYAEDQPLPYTILTAHVLYRGLQLGTTLGVFYGTARSLLLLRKSTLSSLTPTLGPLFQRTAGKGALWGIAAMVVALPIRMWGREGIEWSDRSWRLLENAGQVEVDDWSGIGTIAGAAAALWGMRGEVKPVKNQAVRVVGGAGLGSMVGVVGYMAYRYGMHGGKR